MEKTKILILTIMSGLLGMSTLFGAHGNSLDEDGCWDGLTSYGDSCMVVHETYWRDNKFVVKYRNQCSHRIYARFCNGREDGNPDCGASGIGAGSIKTWYTYNANGRYSYRAIGSDISNKDWVCAGKVRGWND